VLYNFDFAFELASQANYFFSDIEFSKKRELAIGAAVGSHTAKFNPFAPAALPSGSWFIALSNDQHIGLPVS
jgi:hypothetical protein